MKTKAKLIASLKIWVIIYPSITLFLYFFGEALSVFPLYVRTFVLYPDTRSVDSVRRRTVSGFYTTHFFIRKKPQELIARQLFLPHIPARIIDLPRRLT